MGIRAGGGRGRKSGGQGESVFHRGFIQGQSQEYGIRGPERNSVWVGGKVRLDI